MKKTNIPYKMNSILLAPFLITFCILSVILPIQSDNTLFYVSGTLFLLSTVLIPINHLVMNNIDNMEKKYTIHKIFESIHSISLILAITLFLIWFLNLGY
jgi:hypothetical protein